MKNDSQYYGPCHEVEEILVFNYPGEHVTHTLPLKTGVDNAYSEHLVGKWIVTHKK